MHTFFSNCSDHSSLVWSTWVRVRIVFFFDSITNALVSGEKVQIVGFGGFEVRERPAHKGHNPMTGEEIEIAASKSPAFKAGKALKEALN